MDPHPTRIAPLPIEAWDDDTRELRGKMLGTDGKPINIFATLAHHPKLLRRWLVFATHVLSKNTVPERDRELAILRVGWLCRSLYEWGQHVAIAKRIGITADEIDAIAAGPDDGAWSTDDASLLRAVDELHHDARIGDTTWAALSARYSTEQLLDLVFTVGQYTLVSMALNTCGVPLDPGVDARPMTNL